MNNKVTALYAKDSLKQKNNTSIKKMGSIYKLLRLTSREKEFVLEGFQLKGKENLMINSQKGQLSLKKSRRR